MSKPQVLVLGWLPEGALARLVEEFSSFDIIDGSQAGALDKYLAQAVIVYGLPPVDRLGEAMQLKWIQLVSAGVPQDLCPAALRQQIHVTNLAGLYGSSIAEHALTLMGMLSRNLQVVLRNQQEKRWDRSVMKTMADLQGRTLGLVGLGNIGQGIARLARAYGMRILGCRRRDKVCPLADRVYPLKELHALLAEVDYLAVATPLTRHTEGMLGEAAFQAMKRGVIYVNVSRGGIAREESLLNALRSGQVAAAGLDVFAVEPLAADHPFWSMPQVIVSPHYSGETINQSARPVERFARNLRAWTLGRELEGVVNLEWGY
jgi:phosphoglycerate dehydrogenase-like enzyme